MKKFELLALCAVFFLVAGYSQAATTFVDSRGNLISIDNAGNILNLGPVNGSFARACGGSYVSRRGGYAGAAFLPGGNNINIINNNVAAPQMQAAAAVAQVGGRRGRRNASAAAAGNGAAVSVTTQRRGLFGRRSITTASAVAGR